MPTQSLCFDSWRYLSGRLAIFRLIGFRIPNAHFELPMGESLRLIGIKRLYIYWLSMLTNSVWDLSSCTLPHGRSTARNHKYGHVFSHTLDFNAGYSWPGLLYPVMVLLTIPFFSGLVSLKGL